MPRAGRTFEEGRIYRVSKREGGGWMAFSDEKLTEYFVELLRGVLNRAAWPCFGWWLLGNHVPLILRQGPVSLWGCSQRCGRRIRTGGGSS